MLNYMGMCVPVGFCMGMDSTIERMEGRGLDIDKN